jgi:regulator of sigma E protease
MLGQDDNPSNIANERKRSETSAPHMTHEVSAAGLDLEHEPTGPIDRSKLDPRSYQAKSVPQRMAIISAGVIMNLIFSVIFATIAFRSGVHYEPPIIGQTVPGSPGYVADLDGAEVLKVNGRSTTDSYYTFQHLSEDIILNGTDKAVSLELRLPAREGRPSEIVTRTVTPVLNISADFPDIPALGVVPAATTRLADPCTIPGHAAELAQPPLQKLDTVVEINGVPVTYLWEMRREFAKTPEKPVEVVVVRAADKKDAPAQRLKITIPPNPISEFGLNVGMGAVRAVQIESPAEKSGIQVGDILETLNGEPIGDPMTLPYRLLSLAREKADVQIGLRRPGRGDGQPIKLTVNLRPPHRQAPTGNTLIGIDSLGVALEVLSNVSEVEPDGPAAQAGIQVGDEITGAKFLIDEALKKKYDNYFSGPEEVKFEKGFIGWTNIFDSAQHLPASVPVELHITRGSEKLTCKLTPRVSTRWFSANRGIVPSPVQRTYRSLGWWESIQLGADRTYRDMGRVLRMLEKLVRGKIAIKHLGGPLSIGTAATMEASEGSSRLLLFLTLLGANLAILNFLPIPILDGGHMMFLAYEGIFRRPVNERVQIILSFIGLFFIIGLMLLAISLDISRFLFQ